MNFIAVLPVIVFFVSGLTAFQALTNAKLSHHVDSPIWVSFISFTVGAILLLVVGLIVNGKFMTIETEGLKWWMFVSGAIGALFVTVALLAVPHVGIAVLVSFATAGALTFAAILDHYGVLSDTPHPMTLMKLAGLVFLAMGAVLTLKG